MGVDHSADIGECLVEGYVGRGVGRRAKVAFHHFAVEVDNHHVGCLHDVVIDSRGFDYNQAAGAVDGAYVTPGEDHQPVGDEAQVGLEHFLFQRL